MTPAKYCENRTRGSGSSFFYAFLFLPEKKRRAMMALYAFCREVDDVADEVQEQSVAMNKLQFWRDEVARVFTRSPQHMVGKELLWVSDHFHLAEELLLEMIDGMLMDVRHISMLKSSDLSLYCYRVAGVVGLLSIEVFGYSNRKSRDFATTLGEAFQLTNILRDLAEDAAISRIYLPQDARIQFNVKDQNFIEGKLHEGMRALLQEYGNKTQSLYEEALKRLPIEDREALRPSLLMAAIYYAHLKQLQQINFDVWRHPVRIAPLRKIWIAWRCYRYEKSAIRRSLPLRLSF
ncbi:MAG: presqualene diphosphate synthase HpnD [Mariprofundaceae bacterium]